MDAITSSFAGTGDVAKAVGAAYFSSMHKAELERADLIPPGPCIFVSNHWSDGDAFFLCSMLPRDLTELCIVVSESVTKALRAESSPFVWMMRDMELISVRRRKKKTAAVLSQDSLRKERGVIEQALDAISRGKSVILFPHGAICSPSTPVRRTRVHSGCVVLACLANIPIVPIYISGTHKAWPPGASFPEPGIIVKGCTGNPIIPEMICSSSCDRQSATHAAREIMRGIYRMRRKVLSKHRPNK